MAAEGAEAVARRIIESGERSAQANGMPRASWIMEVANTSKQCAKFSSVAAFDCVKAVRFFDAAAAWLGYGEERRSIVPHLCRASGDDSSRLA
jgi:hypothetical protein